MKEERRAFAAKKRFRAAAVAVRFFVVLRSQKCMARLTPQELNALRMMYVANSPIQSASQLLPLLNELSIRSSEEEIKDILSQHTIHRDGAVLQWRSLERLAMALKGNLLYCGGSDATGDGGALHSAFSAMDVNDTGFVASATIASILSEFCIDPQAVAPLDTEPSTVIRNSVDQRATISQAHQAMDYRQFELHFASNSDVNYAPDDTHLEDSSLRVGAVVPLPPLARHTSIRSVSKQQSVRFARGGGGSFYASQSGFHEAMNMSGALEEGSLFSPRSAHGGFSALDEGAEPIDHNLGLLTKDAFASARKWMARPPPEFSVTKRQPLVASNTKTRQQTTTPPSPSDPHASSESCMKTPQLCTDSQAMARLDRSKPSPVGFSTSARRFEPVRQLTKPSGTSHPTPVRANGSPKRTSPRNAEWHQSVRRYKRGEDRLLAFGPTAYLSM